MLRLYPPALSATTTVQLADLQSIVDGEPDYPTQVSRAKAKWGRKTSSNAKRAAIAEVREQLAAMSYGQRCHYCEDSCADEIEHVRPKDLYPDWAFQWDNFVYSCGGCNGPKSNKFAVLDAADGLVPVQRARNAPVIPPLGGRMALLDPRVDDPLDFLLLDLRSTFHFVPHPTITGADQRRAEYTLDLLHLNDRPHLVRLRQFAYASYNTALVGYAVARLQGQSPGPLMIEALRNGLHRTVWEEMKRQRDTLPTSPGSTVMLAKAFEIAPELLAW